MILCIDIDAFFVSVEQALNPHLRGKPVIVGGLPSQRGVVASASYEARRYGIKAGMPLSHAYRLCPRAIFLRGSFHNYEAYSAQFYEILTHYSPLVEMASLDEAFLDIRGTKRLFGEPEELARKIKSEIRERLSLPTTIGIASNRTIAKIATDYAKPDGLIVIPQGKEIEFLSPLPVGVLPGIGPKNFEILNCLGIEKVEDFLRTPPSILNLALGSQARIINFLIYGGDYKYLPKTRSVSRETTFNEDTLDLDFVEAMVYYLLERACHQIRSENLLGRTISVKIRFSDFKTVSTQRKIFPTNCQQIIFPVARTLLHSLLKERKRIRLVGVNISELIPANNQKTLFDKKTEKLKLLNSALDRIRKRFGFSSVFSARVLRLKDHYQENTDGYILHTPSLSQ